MIWLIIELLTGGISEELLIEFLIEKFLAKSSFLKILLRNSFKRGYKTGYQRGYAKAAKKQSKKSKFDLFKLIKLIQGRGLETIAKNALKINKINLFKEGRKVNNKGVINNLVLEQFNKEARSIFGRNNTAPVANARKELIRLMEKQERNRARILIDSSFQLSSSWLYKGVWKANDKNSNLGSLDLTVKKEKLKGNKVISVVIGKTYTYYNVSLSTWTLMKEATGRYGTGAGSVFWDGYLKGGKGTGADRPFQWSEQVMLSRKIYQKTYGK